MRLRRTANALALALLGGTHLGAVSDDRELYQAEVCNSGQLAVDVAIAYRDWGFNDPYWVIEYWWSVKPGRCETIFSHFYAPNNWLSYQSFPLHLAFAFTDSTGVWGAAMVRPPSGVAASRFKLCVGRKNYKYRLDGKSPQAACPKALLIPASIDWEPTRGAVYQEFLGYGHPRRFVVALGRGDRAIPLDGATPAAPRKPADEQSFHNSLERAANAIPWQQETRGPDGTVQMKPGYRRVNVCVDPSIAYKGGVSDPQSVRAKAFAAAVKSFLASHGTGRLRVQLTEADGAFALERITRKDGDCARQSDIEYTFQAPESRDAQTSR